MENWGIKIFLGGRGAKFLGVWARGALKNRSEVKGEGVKSGYKTIKDLNPSARVGLFAEILAPYLNTTTLRLRYSLTSPISWDSSIVMTGTRLEIFQIITLSGQPGE